MDKLTDKLKGTIRSVKNPKNIISEGSLSVGSYLSSGLGVYLSDSLDMDDATSSRFIASMQSSGAFVGKVAGYYFCNREMAKEDFKEFKKDVRNIATIFAPHQICVYLVNSEALFQLQSSGIIDNSDRLETFIATMAITSVCSIPRYIVEKKFGILK